MNTNTTETTKTKCQFCNAPVAQDPIMCPWGGLTESTCDSCEFRGESDREREIEVDGMCAFERQQSDLA